MNFAAENKLPISAIVCTLNEERNIEGCLEAVFACRPGEVLVIDGGSDDETVTKANQFDVNVIQCAKKGLAYQRYKGVHAAKLPYIAFIDADDVLDKDALSISLEQLKKNDYKAIGIQSGAWRPSSYWQRAMGFLNEGYHNKPGDTIMVGRPSVYDTQTLIEVGIDPDWGVGIGNEDTDLSIRYESQGYKMGIGTGKSLRKHPSGFRESLKAWIKYGKGDAKISKKHPMKKRNMLSQVYRKYFGAMTLCAARAGKLQYLPFIWMMGIVRFTVAVWHLLVYPEKL